MGDRSISARQDRSLATAVRTATDVYRGKSTATRLDICRAEAASDRVDLREPQGRQRKRSEAGQKRMSGLAISSSRWIDAIKSTRSNRSLGRCHETNHTCSKQLRPINVSIRLCCRAIRHASDWAGPATSDPAAFSYDWNSVACSPLGNAVACY